MSEDLQSTAFERYQRLSRRGRAQPRRRTVSNFALYPASLAMTALLLWISYLCFDVVARCIVRAVELLSGA